MATELLAEEFSEEELTLFLSEKKVEVLKDLRGSYRTPSEVKQRLTNQNIHIAYLTVTHAIEQGLDLGFIENIIHGKKFFYKTTTLFIERYKRLKQCVYYDV